MTVKDLVEVGQEMAVECRSSIANAPVTRRVAYVMLAGAAFQFCYIVTTETPSFEQVTHRLFDASPAWGWTLSPILHESIVAHLGLNLVGVLVAGSLVERHLGPRWYAVLVLTAAIASSAVGGVLPWMFGDARPGYGASGIVFALILYGLFHFRVTHSSRSAGENLVGIFGVSGIILIALNIFSGPYFEPNWFNGGHLGGAIVGLVAFLLHERIGAECRVALPI
jgi:membrane associated rhomboid family serine protease